MDQLHAVATLVDEAKTRVEYQMGSIAIPSITLRDVNDLT